MGASIFPKGETIKINGYGMNRRNYIILGVAAVFLIALWGVVTLRQHADDLERHDWMLSRQSAPAVFVGNPNMRSVGDLSAMTSDSQTPAPQPVPPEPWAQSKIIDYRESLNRREYLLADSRFESPVYVSAAVSRDAAGVSAWRIQTEYLADKLLAVSQEDDRFFQDHFSGTREFIFSDKVVCVNLPTATLDAVDEALDSAARLGIAASSPSYICHSDGHKAPNDPRFTQQWHHSMIGSTAAWTKRTDAGTTVVAVVDGGLNTTHEDIAANLWVNSDEIPNNNKDDDGNGYIDDYHGLNAIHSNGRVTDYDGHGTACAGVICAVGNNGKGISGVAWKAKLMTLRFMNQGSGSLDKAIRCYNYAIDNGAHILSCSFTHRSASDVETLVMDELRDEKIIVVAAAGNYAANIDHVPYYPAAYAADYSNVVAVGATTERDNLSTFSNFGSKTVQIAAPGEKILTLAYNSSNGYVSFSGTSAATPVVAGALALIRANSADKTPRSVINQMVTTADVLPQLSNYVKGGRRLNLAAALNIEESVYPASEVTSLTAVPEPSERQVTLRWTGGSTYYRVYRSTSVNGPRTLVSPWQRGTSFNDYSAEEGGTYYYWIVGADDAYGANRTALSEPFEVTAVYNDDTLIEGAPGVRLAMSSNEVRAESPWNAVFVSRPSLRGRIRNLNDQFRNVGIRSYAPSYPADTIYAEYRSVAHKLYEPARLNTYNNKGRSIADFLNDLSQRSFRLVMVDGVYRQNGKTKRIGSGYSVKLTPPTLNADGVAADTVVIYRAVDTELVATSYPMLTAGAEVVVTGRYFGARKPKVWLEYYVKQTGKYKRLNLKVVNLPSYESLTGVPGKSYTDPTTGGSQIVIRLPAKWPKKLSSDEEGICRLVVNSRIGLAFCPVYIAPEMVVGNQP